MDHSDIIFNEIRKKGPLIPSELKKTVNIDLMFIQAYLAQFTSTKKLRVSRVKIGGSPLYYIPGQEAMLEQYINRLKAPEQKIVLELKDKKILDDKTLEPLDRVALQNSKDFATLLRVKINEDEKLFWKYFLVRDEEASSLIRLKLQEVFKGQNIKPQEIEKPVEISKPVETPTQSVSDEKETTNLEDELKTLKEKLESLVKEKSESEITLKEKEIETESTLAEKETENIVTEQNEEIQDVKNSKDDIISESIKPKTSKEKKLDEFSKQEIDDEFYLDIKSYFDKKGVQIINTEIVKKKSEINMTISVPTPFGNMKFYCNAKSKKRSNEGDLSAAFLRGKFHNLPSIYLTKGKATKKALDMLDREYKGLVYEEF